MFAFDAHVPRDDNVKTKWLASSSSSVEVWMTMCKSVVVTMKTNTECRVLVCHDYGHLTYYEINILL